MAKQKSHFTTLTLVILLLAATLDAKGRAASIDLSILVSVRNENLIYARNCLRSLYTALEKQHENINAEVILYELGLINKHFERKLGLLNLIEQYSAEGKQVSFLESDKRGWPSLSRALNAAYNSSSEDHVVLNGKNILFIDEKVEVFPDFFLRSIDKALSSSNVGIVGAKLIRTDNTVYHAGIGFSLAKLPKKDTWSYSSYHYSRNRRGFQSEPSSSSTPTVQEEDEDRNSARPYYLYQGHNAAEQRVSKEIEVEAVSIEAMMIRTELLRDLGGFNESLGDTYAGIDLCLRVKHLTKKKVILSPDFMGYHFGNSESFGDNEVYRPFEQIWGSILTKTIRESYLTSNVTLIWNMECGKGAVLGFTTEALGFVIGLQSIMPIKVEVNNIDQCKEDMESIGLPVSKLHLLERLSNIQVDTPESILVIHRDPGRYQNFVSQFRKEEPFYIIGRSMYETDRIPDHWISKCNSIPDRIWVPSPWNIETFAFSGVDRNKLQYVPEPIDVHTYDPSITKPLYIPKKKECNFLSIMKWESRKGWNILLRAYFEEFTSKDSVSLYIRSNMDEQSISQYKEFIGNFIKEHNNETNEGDLPQVVLLKDQVPYAELPSLYKAVDAVVLATHGEGWGLPLIEGMSMELPVISTNWSGSTAFMTNENSFLVPVEKLVPSGTEPGHLWAEPSLQVLRYSMRYIYEHPEEARAIGKKARQDLIERFSQERVALNVAEIIQGIMPNVTQIKEWKRNNQNTSTAKQEDITRPPGRVQIKIVEDR